MKTQNLNTTHSVWCSRYASSDLQYGSFQVSDIPQDEFQNSKEEPSDTEFIIHHNYAGMADFESNMRLEIHAGDNFYPLLA